MSAFLFLIGLQIIFESLPISSSGHILLFEHFFNYFGQYNFVSIAGDTIVTSFLHGPTVIILAIFFFDRWSLLLRNFKRCLPIVSKLVFFVCVADFITLSFFIFFKKIDDYSFFPVGLGFIVSAISLFSLRFVNKKTYNPLTVGKAAVIGAVQGICLLPGVSRFGLTFVTACWMGIAPRKAFEFSFAIQWPLILLGFLNSLRFLPNLFTHGIGSPVFFLIIIVSSIISFCVLSVVKKMVYANKLWVFSLVLSVSFVVWLVFVCCVSNL